MLERNHVECFGGTCQMSAGGDRLFHESIPIGFGSRLKYQMDIVATNLPSTNEKNIDEKCVSEPLNRAVTTADDEANEIKNALCLYVSELRWNFETATARWLRVAVGQFCIEFAAKATLRHRIKLHTKSTRLPKPFGTKRLRPKRSEMEHMNKRENMCREGLWLWNDRKPICFPHFIRELIYF